MSGSPKCDHWNQGFAANKWYRFTGGAGQAMADKCVATGEGADKAGAYGVQGMASRFVTRVDGSYSAVVGLSVAVVHALLREAGLWHYPMGEVRNP